MFNSNNCNCNKTHCFNSQNSNVSHDSCNNTNSYQPTTTDSDCNCFKKDLRESFEILASNIINSYINFSSFTLYTQTTTTAPNATTLRSLDTCNCDLIEYSDGSLFTSASLCALVGYSFQLLNPTVNLPLFVTALENILCTCKGYCNNAYCPQSSCVCHCDCDDCCCADGIEAKLSSTLGTVNVFVKGSLGTISNARVLATTDSLVFLAVSETSGSPVVPTSTIYVVPFENIELLG